MTRINVAIKPSELNSKHLIAEHREIKRIPNCIKSGRFNLDNQPSTFKLGEGHVKFFYDKLKYLHNRYTSIYEECLNRNFNITYYGQCFEGLPEELYNDYTETPNDRKILIERLLEKDNSYHTIKERTDK